METPEFLVWSLGYCCPVRGFEDGTDPERTERQLRAARAASDARREGRICEGLAVDPPHAFRVADALALYGGEAAVAAACGACPANVASGKTRGTWAGCCGLMPLPPDALALHTVQWHGLWLHSPLDAAALPLVGRALQTAMQHSGASPAMSELAEAIDAAIRFGLPLHAKLYPAGRVEGTWWRLAPHCPRCKAAWSGTGRCNVCGYVGHPAPDKKRRARGRRPYFPLDRLLGAAQAAEFLLRYEAFWAASPGRPSPPGPRQSRPPPARPDSPPAG